MKTSSLKLQLIIILLISSFSLNAQNGISFDNVDDYIAVPNASSLIAGSSELSMAFWVYPRNTAPSFPDFDGILGFRNNSNADFYMLQLNATNVEVRFRNSSGNNYDIVYTGLQVNTWNHFVITYNGSEMILYHDGIAVDTVAATGVINSTTTAFEMGRTFYSSPSFYFDGKLDHVALWDKELTPFEISAAYGMICEYDTSDANLQLAFDFSQGIINGNNSSISTINDDAGNIDGTIYNMAMTGSNSNITLGIKGASTDQITVSECLPSYTSPGGTTYTASGIYSDTLPVNNVIGCDSILIIDLTFAPLTSSISETACVSYLSPAGNVYASNGTYYDTVTSVGGCDSIITISLFLFQPNTAVTQVEDTLTVASSPSTFQWIDCNDGSPISGATGLDFTPTDNGDYAVVVTLANGCSDTSACFTVTIWANGIDEPYELTLGNVYPNPAQDVVTIQLKRNLKNPRLLLTDIGGKTIRGPIVVQTETINYSLEGLPEGIYLLQIITDDQMETVRVIKTY